MSAAISGSSPIANPAVAASIAQHSADVSRAMDSAIAPTFGQNPSGDDGKRYKIRWDLKAGRPNRRKRGFIGWGYIVESTDPELPVGDYKRIHLCAN